MTVTLGDLLRHRRIKQIDVVRTLRDKYNLKVNNISYLCGKEGDWFSKNASVIQECLKNEYGIYYDGSVWRGGNK
jgi:hypothetical protein